MSNEFVEDMIEVRTILSQFLWRATDAVRELPVSKHEYDRGRALAELAWELHACVDRLPTSSETVRCIQHFILLIELEGRIARTEHTSA